MTLPVLRDDALTTIGEGFELRLSLPWIRSLPLSCASELSVSIDGRPAPARVRVGDRVIEVDDLAGEDRWWFLQDRLVVVGDVAPDPGPHTVAVSFRLLIPYLPSGPDAPLELPFHSERQLVPSLPEHAVSRDVA